MNVQYLSKAMLDYSETSENVYLTFNHHIELKNKKFKILVHLTFKALRIESTYVQRLDCLYGIKSQISAGKC